MSVTPDHTKLVEGDRRQPYFYTHGRSVLCVACADAIFQGAPAEAKRIQAHYFIARLLRCNHCLILIGPANPEEAVPL